MKRLNISRKCLIAGAAALLLPLTAFAAPRATSVRQVNADHLPDTRIIYPESFEPDVH